MKSYLDIVNYVFENGIKKEDRTGTGTTAVAGAMFKHNMADGFPLLTTKKVPYRLVASELEFFIKGLTDKQWLIDRNNHIWDEWCSTEKVPYGHDEATKKKMMEERDLGPIYGWQWRHYGADYKDYDTDYTGKGFDQLKRVVDMLKKTPYSRQNVLIAWSPKHANIVVPPFCHYGFQVTVLDGKLNLMWNQRSVDIALGLPFNIASYATMLHLLAKEAGLEEGLLVGFLGDTHFYSNHEEGLKEQLSRDPNKYKLPKLETENFTSIFDWTYTDSKVVGYESYPRIKFDIAV